jgi:hypothetical protein
MVRFHDANLNKDYKMESVGETKKADQDGNQKERR